MKNYQKIKNCNSHTFLNNFKGRGAFIFSDPGGAKPVLSLIWLLKLKDIMIISDREYSFYIDYNLKVNKYKNGDEIQTFIKFKPDFIYTGTSYTSKIELKFLKEAKNRKIKSFSFIDHYTNYNERFNLNNKYILPDKIFVTDIEAKKIVKSSNVLSKVPVKAIGNYYHKYLENWNPKVEKKSFFSDLNISSKTKIILFAPDPLSNLKNNIFEFDENDVLQTLLLALKSLNDSNILLLIKAHPNQNIEYLSSGIRNSYHVNIFISKTMDVKHLIHFSDIIIGMHSSLLIEANFFNKKIIRHLPKQIEDPFKNLKLGIVTVSDNQLAKAIKILLSN